MANVMNLFNMLGNGLHDAKKAAPEESGLLMGFTNFQILKMQMSDPRLIWYDKDADTYYDQGSSKKIGPKNYGKITATNFKKDKPIANLKYYIPMTKDIMKESSNINPKEIYKK